MFNYYVKEKVQEFINLCDRDVCSTRGVYVIDTMGVEYDGLSESWCHVIRFNEPVRTLFNSPR